MAEEERLLEQFQTAHLPERLRVISEPFGNLARWMADAVPSSPERTIALRHVWDAKNYAVMAVIQADREAAQKDGAGERTEPEEPADPDADAEEQPRS